MKEFEFDDIEVSDEKEEIKEKKPKKLKEDPLYQKFSFDIDADVEEKEEIKEETNINNLFEEKEEEVKDSALFVSSNDEIDNPFVSKKVEEENKISAEEEVENMYKEANKNIKPIISFDEKEIEDKEDALEEALSHTTKFTPFRDEKPEVNDLESEETKDGKESNGIAYLVALFIILLIAVFVIPKIASLL